MIEEDRPFDGFDESRYLQSNPDVLQAVKTGTIPSGWEHYRMFGYRENRSGVDLEVGREIKNILEILEENAPETVPPPHLRKRVHGVDDISSFEQVGKTVSFDIYKIIRSASIALPTDACILDFGCGCGRIMRYFHKLYVKGEFYGTDIDKQAIAWCKEHLSYIGNFTQNENWPPLAFDEGFFDFVYSISIFTHLPEDMQFKWLEELRRVTKPGGYLLLTTHGPELLPARAKRARQKLMSAGFYYMVRFGTSGLPRFYQTAFHTEHYITSEWGRLLDINRIVKKGIAGHQDLILCRRR
jgi:ubiquinone/menaquinone biosynthesis C-methylase UbiE